MYMIVPETARPRVPPRLRMKLFLGGGGVSGGVIEGV